VLYRKLLLRFLDDNANSVSKISACLQRNDLPTASREAHSLKGVAGNIGAVDLQREVTVVDALLEKGNTTEALNLLPSLAAQLDRVIKSISALKPAEAVPPPTDVSQLKSFDPETLMPHVNRLEGLLREENLDARKEIGSLEELLAGTVHSNAVTAISNLVSEYEFESALTKLIEVRKSLEMKL
jgi:HPt (histidine-containing phosphotransfer) domain-containing protein